MENINFLPKWVYAIYLFLLLIPILLFGYLIVGEYSLAEEYRAPIVSWIVFFIVPLGLILFLMVCYFLFYIGKIERNKRSDWSVVIGIVYLMLSGLFYLADTLMGEGAIILLPLALFLSPLGLISFILLVMSLFKNSKFQ